MQELGIGSRIKHKQFGMGVIIQVKTDSYLITFYENGTKVISKDFAADFEIFDAVEPSEDLVSLEDIEKSLTKIIQRFSDIQETVPLGNKWSGGQILLQPGDKNLKEKIIPMDVFFHKIVMIRDRLRTLEQRVNASNMTDEEKVNCQQYITRCYGSLTTFNVLFQNPSDQFAGDKGE